MDKILGVVEAEFTEEEVEADAEEEPAVEDVISPRSSLLKAMYVQDIREDFSNFFEASERRSKLLCSGQFVTPPILKFGSLPELNLGKLLHSNHLIQNLSSKFGGVGKQG
uniref:Uncharacterized protein n=1 Tax=Cannabis sativa TaxID=3483 RepID=A0A803QG59_CANSA